MDARGLSFHEGEQDEDPDEAQEQAPKVGARRHCVPEAMTRETSKHLRKTCSVVLKEKVHSSSMWSKSGTKEWKAPTTKDFIIRPKKRQPVVKRAATQVDDNAYTLWLESSRDHEAHDRIVVFNTLGRSPVDQPAHPARLSLIKQSSILDASPGVPSPPACGHIHKDEAPHERPASAPCGSLQRSFSQRCCNVLGDQNDIKPFEPLDIYYSCNFFKTCSQNFVRTLVQLAGPPASVGKSIAPGHLLYEKGDPGESLYVVARGHAEIEKRGLEIQVVRSGGFFGEKEVLGVVSRRQETVRAGTSLHVFEITPVVLMKLLKRTVGEENHEFGFELDADTEGARVLSGAGADSMFPDERRHFESEAVRMYRELRSRSEEAVSSVWRRQITGVSERRSTSGEFCDFGPATRGPVLLERREAAQVQARKGMATRLAVSIRRDMKVGVMMPAEFWRSRNRSRHSTRTQLSASPQESVAAPETSRMSKASQRVMRTSQASGMSQASPNSSRTSQMSPQVSRMSSPNTGNIGSLQNPWTSASPGFSEMSQAKTASSCGSSWHTSVPHGSHSHQKVGVDDGSANDVSDSLEIDALPALSDLSSLQKTSLLRELQVRLKGSMCKPSSTRTGGLMSRFVSRTPEAVRPPAGSRASHCDEGFSQIA